MPLDDFLHFWLSRSMPTTFGESGMLEGMARVFLDHDFCFMELSLIFVPEWLMSLGFLLPSYAALIYRLVYRTFSSM